MAHITKNMEKQVQAIHELCDGVLASYTTVENGVYVITDAEGLKKHLLLASQKLIDRVRNNNEPLENVVTEAFALVRAAFILQTNGAVVLYDEQLLAGLAMMNGNVSELATGEGKTYVQALAAYTYALSGKGVHVMSANQFLVKRDAEKNAPVYQALGMNVGVVPPMDRDAKRSIVAKQMAYAADITYGTDKEIGFDYLRDSTALEKKHLLLRGKVYDEKLTKEERQSIYQDTCFGEPKENAERTGFYACVLDEADSLMLDNARTPLILSYGSVKPKKVTTLTSVDVLFAVDDIVQQIIQEEYTDDNHKKYIDIDEDSSRKRFTLEATDRFFELKDANPVLKNIEDTDLLYLFSRAEVAHLQRQRDKDYILTRDERTHQLMGDFLLIDQSSTGRVQKSSSYQEGVQQAVEAKEKNRLLTLFMVDNIVRQVIAENATKENAYIENTYGFETPYQKLSSLGYARCFELANTNDKLKKLPKELLRTMFEASQMAHFMQRGTNYTINANDEGEIVDSVTIKSKALFTTWGDAEYGKNLLEQALLIKEQNEPYVWQQLQAYQEFVFYMAQGKNIIISDTLLGVRRKLGVPVSEEDQKNPVLNMTLGTVRKAYKRFHNISQETNVSATINQQTFFSFYENKSGMTGTAMSSKSEFQEVYGMDVVAIPTHKPKQRVDEPAKLFASKKEKYLQLVKDVQLLHEKEVPILIGASTEEEAVIITNLLREAGLTNVETLTAKDDAREAEIVKHAGKRNAITVTTSVGGRGTDIKLGGADDEDIPAEQRAQDKAYIESQGGLHVLLTQLSESKRVDDQLRGRSGRQGDKGTTILYVSAQDDIVKYLSKKEQDRLAKSAKEYAEIEAQGAEVIKRKQHVMQKHYDKSMELLESAQIYASGIAELGRIQSFKIDKIQAENRKFTTEMRQELLLLASPEKTENVEEAKAENMKRTQKLKDILSSVVTFYLENMLQAEVKTLSSVQDLQNIDVLLNAYIFGSDENYVRHHWNEWVKNNPQLSAGSDKKRLEALANCIAMSLVAEQAEMSDEEIASTAQQLLGVFDEEWIDFIFGFQELQKGLFLEQQFGAKTDFMKEIENRAVTLYGQMLQNIGLKFTNKAVSFVTEDCRLRR